MSPLSIEEQQRCLSAVENLATAVLLLDGDLRVLYLNPAAEMLLAVSRRKALNRPLTEFLIAPAEFADTLAGSLREGSSLTERELALGLHDGRSLTADCTVSPLSDERRGTLLIELQPLDRHLRIAREEHLLSLQQATGTLLRGLAHEIRNPLGGLRGAAQLLEREFESAELAEYTQVIIREADRLEALLTRMLGPRGTLQRQATNVHEVLERVRVLVQAEVAAGIHIDTDYDPSIPDLLADRDQLIQALLNIVRNAAQALEDGGTIRLQTRIERQFTIGPVRHRLVARIDVVDDGPGIEPHMLEQIFFPMVTGRPEGSGLGLPIAQSLINQHGGLIECTSLPGQTVFTVRLPLEDTNG